MKVSEKEYSSIDNWSNPMLARFMYFIYGPIDKSSPLLRQKVRYDDDRKILNESFILPNLEDEVGTSFIDRYNLLKQFKFDPDVYIDYLNKLIEVNSIASKILSDKYLNNGIYMKDGYLNFTLRFNTNFILSLRDALIRFKQSIN